MLPNYSLVDSEFIDSFMKTISLDELLTIPSLITDSVLVLSTVGILKRLSGLVTVEYFLKIVRILTGIRLHISFFRCAQLQLSLLFAKIQIKSTRTSPYIAWLSLRTSIGRQILG